LLACCLMQEGDTLARCIEAGIVPGSFFLPANAALFAALLAVNAKGLPVDVAIVGEALKASGQLDASGGYAHLTRVSGAVNTEAGAASWIDRVAELAHARKVLALSQVTLDRCHEGETPALDLLEPFIALHDSATLSSSVLKKKLDALRLHTEKEPPPLRVIFRIGKAAIGTPGNLVTVKGHSKAGKSAFIGGMIGATMRGERDGDCLGVTSENPDGHAVIHFDTEQSKRDHFNNFKIVLKRADLNKEPEWFRSYALTGLTIKERLLALRHVLKLSKRECGGIHSVFLDGIADLVSDPNEAAECFGFVDDLQALAVEYDCVIICVLHLNPGSEDKGRGHLGSHLERRSEANLRLDYDPETGRTVVWAEKNRRAPIPKADGPCFRWNEASQMHVSVETMRSEKEAAEREHLTEIAQECYANCPSKRMKYSALVEAIKLVLKCVDSTGAQKVARMRKLSVVRDVPPRLLELAA